MKSFFQEFWMVLKAAGKTASRYNRAWILLLLVTCAVGWWIHPVDTPWIEQYTVTRDPVLLGWARGFRKWGEFNDSFFFFFVTLFAAYLFKKRSWRLAAKTFFMAAIVGGLLVNVFRFGAGRPRPHQVDRLGLEDRFYGPTFDYKKQSFPSGHTCTSTAGAIAMLVVWPPMGVPAMISAAGVAWSSFYSRSHYPSDLVVGAGLGLCVGLIFGMAGRRWIRDPNRMDE